MWWSGRKVFLVGVSVIIVVKWWSRTCVRVELCPFCWVRTPVKLTNNTFYFFCFFSASEKCICKGICFCLDISLCNFQFFLLWLPPQPKDVFGYRWIGDSKLALGVDVSVNCCFYSVSPKSWPLIQGVLSLSPEGIWDGLQSLWSPTKV